MRTAFSRTKKRHARQQAITKRGNGVGLWKIREEEIDKGLNMKFSYDNVL